MAAIAKYHHVTVPQARAILDLHISTGRITESPEGFYATGRSSSLGSF